MHWRKSMSERAGLGGLSTDALASSADTRADLNPLSLQPVLHRQNISYPPLNIGCVILDAILGTIAGVALLASVFIVLFVRT
jgi:hypothetical protein